MPPPHLNDMVAKVKNVNKDLNAIPSIKFSDFSVTIRPEKSTSICKNKVIGREEEMNTLVNLLLSESCQSPTIPVISIVGMPGIGKTTLAQLVFNDHKVITHFQNRIWVCVSEPFDELQVAKAILQSLSVKLDSVQYISQSMAGKKFLLVLDDVWTEDSNEWARLGDSFKFCSKESRILVTTHKENVADMMGTTNMISLGPLPKEESWKLFCEVATFPFDDKLNRIIVDNCQGLPLAVQIVAGLMSSGGIGDDDWSKEIWERRAIQGNLFPHLWRSYKELPSILRKCFSYCAFFPKGYVIEKDRLIKLWMAQGYLKVERNKDLKLIGEEYFDSLAKRSFFHNFETSEDDGSIITCEMHDAMHGFAKYINSSDDYHATGQRHAMIILEGDASFPDYVFYKQQLRSLVVERRDALISEENLSKLFDQLNCLTTLDLSNDDSARGSIRELPTNVDKLIHLRHLNLSKNQMIERLPETLCNLIHLQILDVSWCIKLKTLPDGMEKLIGLTGLVNDRTDALSRMPEGIGRLTRLQTLSKLVVSNHAQGGKACTMSSLRNLNHLHGSLILSGLGNVEDGEAKRADLKKKENLLRLSLTFERDEEEGRRKEDDEYLLKALQPPPNIERLGIYLYRGYTLFPEWMMALTKLKTLILTRCTNCKRLPPLGKLPYLESLKIRGMSSVKRVGTEFLGTEFSVTAFPKLKSLHFWYMEQWEVWDFGVTREAGVLVQIMPCLQSLTIQFCPKVKALPGQLIQKEGLRELHIHQCTYLEERYKKGEGEDQDKIARIPNFRMS